MWSIFADDGRLQPSGAPLKFSDCVDIDIYSLLTIDIDYILIHIDYIC